MTLRWESTKQQLDKLREELHEKRGVRNQLLKSKQEETVVLVESQAVKQRSEKANLFLLSEITNRRKQAISAIENIGSSALKMIYGNGYGINFCDFEDVRKAGTNNFKMEIQMSSDYGKGGKPLVTKLFGSRGGGCIEVSATSLRLGALDWHQYDGPVLFDETFKSMSKDMKIHMVARWMKAIHELTGRQIIFATHMGDIFGKISNKIFYVSNDLGHSTVREIDYEELKVLRIEMDALMEGDEDYA
jgi:hypothetical protein